MKEKKDKSEENEKEEVDNELPNELKEIMGEIIGPEPHSPTVPAHYGIKAEEFNDFVFGLFRDLVTNDSHSAILDKWFPKLDQTGRAKVYAYGKAMVMAEKQNDTLR